MQQSEIRDLLLLSFESLVCNYPVEAQPTVVINDEGANSTVQLTVENDDPERYGASPNNYSVFVGVDFTIKPDEITGVNVNIRFDDKLQDFKDPEEEARARILYQTVLDFARMTNKSAVTTADVIVPRATLAYPHHLPVLQDLATPFKLGYVGSGSRQGDVRNVPIGRQDVTDALEQYFDGQKIRTSYLGRVRVGDYRGWHFRINGKGFPSLEFRALHHEFSGNHTRRLEIVKLDLRGGHEHLQGPEWNNPFVLLDTLAHRFKTASIIAPFSTNPRYVDTLARNNYCVAVSFRR